MTYQKTFLGMLIHYTLNIDKYLIYVKVVSCEAWSSGLRSESRRMGSEFETGLWCQVPRTKTLFCHLQLAWSMGIASYFVTLNGRRTIADQTSWGKEALSWRKGLIKTVPKAYRHC